MNEGHWSVIYTETSSTCSFAQSHFLICSSVGFIHYCSTVISWGRREKSHNPDSPGLLGAVSALLATQSGCETDGSLFPRQTQLALPQYEAVSPDRFCATSP